MSRVIIKTAHGPYKISTSEGEKEICMCGLSKNQPFCDKSHLKTLDEKTDGLYQYDEDGHRSELESDDCEDDCGSCCGGGCCEGEESDECCGEKCNDKNEGQHCCGGDCCDEEAEEKDLAEEDSKHKHHSHDHKHDHHHKPEVTKE